jgi:hypothetical protein
MEGMVRAGLPAMRAACPLLAAIFVLAPSAALAGPLSAPPVRVPAPTVRVTPNQTLAAPRATARSEHVARLAAPGHPTEVRAPAFAALRERVATVTDVLGATELGHAIAKEVRSFFPAYRALRAKDAAAAAAQHGPHLEAASTTMNAALERATTLGGAAGAALLAPIARACDESGSRSRGRRLFRELVANAAAPAAEKVHAHVRLGEQALEVVRSWEKEDVSPFERAVLGAAGRPGHHRALEEVASHLQSAADLEVDPPRREALLAQVVDLRRESSAVLNTKMRGPDTTRLSSRERRMVNALVELSNRGYSLDIQRVTEGGESHFLRPSGESKSIVVRYGELDSSVAVSAEEVLGHELQHFFDWAQGKALPRSGPLSAAITTRSEVRANYAATRDVGKALANTGLLYRKTAAARIDASRTEVTAELGPDATPQAVDRATFSRLMRGFRDLRKEAPLLMPEGGPVRTDATPLRPAEP